MLYVGLDVHSLQSSLCILNSGGGTVNQIQLKGPRSTVVDRLRLLEEPFAICYEASRGFGQLRPLAHHVAVAHPGKLRLIYGSKRCPLIPCQKKPRFCLKTRDEIMTDVWLGTSIAFVPSW